MATAAFSPAGPQDREGLIRGASAHEVPDRAEMFNRARYDAEATVAAFAARLKDTVDLDAVRGDLAGVVQQALEPAHISVWTSQPGWSAAIRPTR